MCASFFFSSVFTTGFCRVIRVYVVMFVAAVSYWLARVSVKLFGRVGNVSYGEMVSRLQAAVGNVSSLAGPKRLCRAKK